MTLFLSLSLSFCLSFFLSFFLSFLPSFLPSFLLSFLPSLLPSFLPSFFLSFFLSLYPKNKPGTWKWWFPNKVSEYLGFNHCLLHLSFGECTRATISYNWFLNIHESTPISVAKDNEHSLSSPKKDVVKSAAVKEQLKWAKAFRITAASTSESLSASSINSSKSTFHWATKWWYVKVWVYLDIVQIHVSCMYSSGKTCRPIEAELRHNTALSHHMISKCISIILIYHLALKECWGSASSSLLMDSSANHRTVKKSGKSWDIDHVRALKDELPIQITWYGGHHPATVMMIQLLVK